MSQKQSAEDRQFTQKRTLKKCSKSEFSQQSVRKMKIHSKKLLKKSSSKKLTHSKNYSEKN